MVCKILLFQRDLGDLGEKIESHQKIGESFKQVVVGAAICWKKKKISKEKTERKNLPIWQLLPKLSLPDFEYHLQLFRSVMWKGSSVLPEGFSFIEDSRSWSIELLDWELNHSNCGVFWHFLRQFWIFEYKNPSNWKWWGRDGGGRLAP